MVALRGLMARSTRAGAALCLFVVGFFWSYQPFAGGAAAVALSFFFKKKKMQAAACAAAIDEGVHVSEFLLASAALAFVGLLAKVMRHAAAAEAAANSEGYVHDSLLVIAGVLVSELLLTPGSTCESGCQREDDVARSSCKGSREQRRGTSMIPS